MLFSKFRKRNKKQDKLIEQEENKYEKLVEPVSDSENVVDMCETLVEAAREFEDARKEYDIVTACLNDTVLIDEIPQTDKKLLVEAAGNVALLNRQRDEFLKTEKKISDSQFAQMQEMERDIPKNIRRFEQNEKNLEVVNRDLKYLEGVKTVWEITREDSQNEQKQLRKMSVLIICLFAVIVVLCLVLRFTIEFDTSLILLIGAFLAVLFAAYVFLRYQSCSREIRKADLNRNNAIAMENRVKIKYVNIKNAVDYSCEKYHVRNSKELNYVYELYMEAVREREKFRKTNDDLEYNNRNMLAILDRYGLYDSRVWLNYANAIVDSREMVELKHDLISRRQKLRSRMEYNIRIITEQKSQIILNREKLGDRVTQVNDILKRISELNMVLEK